MQVSFDGQKHIFWLFLLYLRPHTSAGMNNSQRCIVIIDLEYTLKHLDTWFTSITTTNRYIYTVDGL